MRKISEMDYNGEINPYITIKVNGKEISVRIENVFLNKSPYLTLIIRQF